MKSKKTGLHPLLILLAVALVSVLFVVACGDDDAPAVSQDTGAAEAAAASAAASQAAKAAETAAMAAAEAAAQATALSAAVQAAGGAAGESEAVKAAEAAAAQAAAAAEYAASEAAALTAAASAAAGPKRGGTLTFGIIADFLTLDPPIHGSQVDHVISQQLYDNLLMIQPDFSLKPELATAWAANDDNSSFTFILRKGVNFHHGKEFKAEDVVFTFERLMDPELDSPARTTFEVIEDIVIVNDHTVRFDLDGPNGFFLEALSIYQARILPADVDVSRLTLEEFGTGPFILEELLPGERATLVRNPDYWEEGKPYLDEIVIQNIAEAAVRAEALKNGDVDLVYNLEPQSVSSIEAHSDTVVLKAASLGWLGLIMDNRFPPFDNKLVRQAMQAATDRETIRQAALLGLGSNAYDHPIPPTDPRFAPQYAPPAYNPELAKSLLEQAGYPDGIDVELYTADIGAGFIELAVAYKESAAPAGIRVDVQRVSSDAYWDDYWMVKPFSVTSWLGRNLDQALSTSFLSDGKWNETYWNNPEFDALVVRARGETLEQQKVTYAEVQRILIEEVPKLAIAYEPWLYGARTNVRGADPHPMGWGLIQDAWLDD